MKIKTIVFLAVTAGVFAYTRPHNTIPFDLRDAVADNGEFDTSIPGFEKGVGNIPDPKAAVAADSGKAAVAPDVVIKIMIDKVQKNGKTATKDEIAALLAPNFNFEHMSRLAVGRYWAQATEDQRKAMTKEFRTLLVRTYSAALLRAGAIGSDIKIKPLGPQPSAEEALVKTVARLLGMSTEVDYRMERAGETWLVYDVSIDRVSLVLTYRGQFAGEIAGSGMDGLIKTLADKNSGL